MVRAWSRLFCCWNGVRRRVRLCTMSMYNKFVARQVERPWADIAQDCFVVGMIVGIALGCAL